MKKIIYVLLVVLLSSCLQKEKKIGNSDESKIQVEKIEESNNFNEIRLNKLKIYYNYLYENKTITIDEFNHFYGNFYVGAERYYREKLGLPKSDFKSFKDCIENPSDFKSVLFEEILKRKKELIFNYKLNVITKSIEDSRVLDEKIILIFPNNEELVFFFNKKNNIESIIINKENDFMSVYEE